MLLSEILRARVSFLFKLAPKREPSSYTIAPASSAEE